MRRLLAATMGVCFAAACRPALAGEAFVGAFQHAAELHISSLHDQERGLDIELGYRTDSLGWRFIGRPRAYGLLSKNLSGNTDFASAGLLWRRTFTPRLYGQIGLGVAIHDGAVNRADADGDPHKIVFGSRVLFQPELGFGWRLSRRCALEISYVHISNGSLWTKVNPGMDDVGLRFAYRFGGR